MRKENKDKRTRGLAPLALRTLSGADLQENSGGGKNGFSNF